MTLIRSTGKKGLLSPSATVLGMDEVTPAQCRMARAGLDWNVRKLAEVSGVAKNTVTRFEREKAIARPGSVALMRAAMERAGIRFLDGPEPGVALGSAVSGSGGADDRADDM